MKRKPLTFQGAAIEEPCDSCHGNGALDDDFSLRDCPRCGGLGLLPNQDGKALLQLAMQWLETNERCETPLRFRRPGR